jgi:hypothetical protein
MLMRTTTPQEKQAQGSRASGWLSTIRARLYLAFGFAAALTIIGASIAFYEFTIIGSTTNEIVSRSLPATAVSLRLAEQASSLVSSGPRLMTAGTDKVRAEILADINKQEENLETGIAQLQGLGAASSNAQSGSLKPNFYVERAFLPGFLGSRRARGASDRARTGNR